MVHGSSWWFVVVYGGSWWFMVVYGGLWWFIVVYCSFKVLSMKLFKHFSEVFKKNVD